MIEMRFEGIKEVKDAFNKFEGLAMLELAKAVDESGEHLIGKAQDLAPKLKGDLEASGTKDDVIIAKNEVSVKVGFLGLPYALRRHEEVYTPGLITSGKSLVDGMTPGRKYLERPLVYYMKKYIEGWTAAVRGVLS